MFCQKCGASLKEGNIFCSKCGTKVPSISDFATGNTAQSRSDRSIDDLSAPGSKLTAAVISFKNGNTAAFDTIYNESKRYIYYTILKTVGDKETADDIMQETYLDVYRSLNSLENPAVFKVWAAKIAQHKISRYFLKKNPELFSTEEEMDDVVGDITEEDMGALPEDAMINKEVQRLIGEIVDGLPENQRSAILSFYYNQMSIAEIAEAMGVPENTVKTYLFRGKNKIKDGVLEIEKKHGTKLYALPLAGLLGLLFTEEAKAAVVSTTAAQILGSSYVTTAAQTAADVRPVASTAAKTAAKSAAKVAGKSAGKAAAHSVRTLLIGTAAGLAVGAGATAAAIHYYNENKIAEESEYEDESDESLLLEERLVGEYDGERNPDETEHEKPPAAKEEPEEQDEEVASDDKTASSEEPAARDDYYDMYNEFLQKIVSGEELIVDEGEVYSYDEAFKPGYALYDMDGDGVDELFVTGKMDDTEWHTYGVYYIKDNIVECAHGINGYNKDKGWWTYGFEYVIYAYSFSGRDGLSKLWEINYPVDDEPVPITITYEGGKPQAISEEDLSELFSGETTDPEGIQWHELTDKTDLNKDING